MSGTALSEKVWYSTAEAADYTGRHPETVLKHAAAETLRSTQAGRGRGRRYRKEWLDSWVLDAPRLPRVPESRRRGAA